VTLVTAATLVVVVVNNRDTPALFIITAAIAVVGLGQPRVARNPWLWLAMGAAMGAHHLISWEGVDDHVVLTTYWAVAVGLSLLAPDPGRMLALNGRVLAGLTFAFAAFWKVTSGDFVDGDFFRYTLLLDDRFEYVARIVGGMSEEQYLANYHAVGALHAEPGASAALALPTRVSTIALVMTAWGLVSELSAAVTHLVPLPRRLLWLRHFWLFAFAATTYLVVPIGGFGLILLVFGLAQTQPGERRRVAYVAAMAAVLAWAPIWRALFYS
jgi:hypothetical protein